MLGLAPEEGVLALQCSDGLHRVCAADVFGACFRKPEVFDFACLDQILDGASSVFDGRVGVNAVLIKEVSGVGPKALERPLDDPLDVVRTAVQSSPLAVIVRIGLETELGGDDHVFAEGSKCFADDLFIDVRAVDLGSVEERDAALDGGADELDSLRFFRCGAKTEAQAHASETKCRYFKTALA